MKFYTIFTTHFGRDPLAVFIDPKTGKYYVGGPRISMLVFTDKKEAQAVLAHLRRVEDKAFGKSCYVARGIIRQL